MFCGLDLVYRLSHPYYQIDKFQYNIGNKLVKIHVTPCAPIVYFNGKERSLNQGSFFDS